MDEKKTDIAGICIRLAFALVFAWNVECALSFIISPASYVGGYELTGVSGEAAIRGLGIVFLMWNATYPPVIVSPGRNKTLAMVVLVQQAIGLIGESAIYFTLPEGHETLASAIRLFVAFDGAGLVIMGIAASAYYGGARRKYS